MNTDELAALYQTAVDLAGNHDLPDLLRTVLERALTLIGANSGAIGLYDPVYDEIELAVQVGIDLRYNVRRRRGDGMVGHVIETLAPLIVNDYRHSPFRESDRTESSPIGAVLNIPMLYRDELLGVLSLYEAAESERVYTADDARIVVALAALAASAVKNARLRLQAQRSAEMDYIVAGIATRFIHVSADNVDTEIDETLRVIGEFAQVDRSYLFRFTEDGACMNNTHEWCAAGIEPQIDLLQDLPSDSMPWSVECFASGQIVHARRLEDLPPEAAVEKEILAAQDIQSVVLIPILFEARTLGFIGFDAVRHERAWTEHDIALLKLIAEVFALALDRAGAERELNQRRQDLEHRVVERTAALRASEEQLRSLIDNSLQGIILFQDSQILFANRAMAEIVGCAVEELLAADLAELMRRVHPDDQSLLWSMAPVFGPNQPEQLTLQFRICQPTGSVRWVMCMAVLVMHASRPAVQAVMVDITDLKNAEQALLENQQFTERITDTGPMLIFVYDLKEQTDIYINRPAVEFFGYSVEEVAAQGRDFMMSVIHPDDLPAVMAKIERYQDLRDGEIYEQEVRVRSKDGEWHWLLTRDSVFLRAADGSPLQVVGISVEITEIKRSEQAMQEAEIALRDSLAKERELGELKSRFVSMASHEFRTPLATILANAETLLHYRERLDVTKIDDRLTRICGQVEHLSQMIDEILSLTGVQSGKVTPKLELIDLGQFCQRIVDEYANRHDIVHQIQFSSSGESLPVLADLKLLRTVVTNLISNAIKYSPKGSSVVISVGGNDGFAILAVADSGIGIPERDRQHIFNAFHRASNVGSLAGTGLGLSIAKEFTLLMHGAISFDSQVGVGTTFSVTLPVRREASQLTSLEGVPQ